MNASKRYLLGCGVVAVIMIGAEKTILMALRPGNGASTIASTPAKIAPRSGRGNHLFRSRVQRAIFLDSNL